MVHSTNALLHMPATVVETPMRVLVVDDEPTARRRIVRLLSEIPSVTGVGECGSSREALSAIRAQSPDVILLDIAMPGLDGLSLARRLAASAGPLVVFVTAYDEHALEAFRIHAADYVLKPLDRHRLRDALEHARLTIRRVRAEQGMTDATESTTIAGPTTARLAVRDGYRTQIVPIADILWVESFGNYARVYTTVARYTHRATMARLAAELGPLGFARVHRTAIVNAARVVRLQPGRNGQYEAVVDTGLRLRVSRTYRGALERIWRDGMRGD
jgi:two-component system LytT family response regulator